MQPPSPQRAPLRLRLLKSYVNVLACNTRSCCISLETRLVLNSDYIKQFSFFVCVCVTVVLADVSSGLIDVQAARDVFGESPILYTFAG